MKKKTNEIEIVKALIDERGMLKTRLAEKAGMSPFNLAQILLKDDKGLMTTTFVELMKAMDYEVVIVPKWTARELKKDKDNYVVEEKE